MKQAPLIFVLYDGMTNSVFQGQVLQPLLEQKKQDPEQTIYLISFEKQRLTISDYMPKNTPIKLVLAKQIPFIGTISIWYATRQLKKILSTFQAYHIKARGALAGLICQQALEANRCQSVTIQARGLLAAEYEYTHRNQTSQVKKLWHRWRTHELKKVEEKAYRRKNTSQHLTIEAVSEALKEYLIDNFNATSKDIIIAEQDTPKQLSNTQRLAYRTYTRSMLAIPSNTLVFCYNGSAKPWQCPEKVISFFKDRQKHNPRVFLLVLTQDVSMFEILAQQFKLPTKSYYIRHIEHRDIYTYLAGADVGLIFREQSPINWISRPTKALEYQAAHLRIIHNNTIAWLAQLKEAISMPDQ